MHADRMRGAGAFLLAMAVLSSVALARAADTTRAPALSVRVSALVGERANSLDAIDAELARNGYTTTPKVQRTVGFELGATVRRFRFEIGFVGTVGDHVYSQTTGHAVRVHRGWLSPEIGYDVYRFGQFAVFPMLGYASGHLLVEMRCDQPPLFAGYFASAPCSRNVRRGFDAFKMLVGVEDVIPLWHRRTHDGGLLFGVRLGYVMQLGENAWQTGNIAGKRLGDAPGADVGGPFILMNVGVSVFSP